MDRAEVEFLGKMVVDELLELYATVMGWVTASRLAAPPPGSPRGRPRAPSPDDARSTMRRHLDAAKVLPQEAYEGSDSAEQIADQADARTAAASRPPPHPLRA